MMKQIGEILKSLNPITQKKPVPTNFLSNSGLSDEEKQVLVVKYKSQQLKDISPDVLAATVIPVLLIKIHVITGWVIPAGPILVALQDLFQKKLLLDYPDLNVDEIEHAFLTKGTAVEDWGKQMDLNLIDKVLIPYRNERFRISREHEKAQPPPEQKIYSDDELLNQHREEIELAFRVMKKGRVMPTPGYWKQVLVNDELMQEEETLGEFFSRRLATSEQIYTYE